MQSLNFNYQHKPFDKTIQLYGDRAGGQGNFEFAGLAELQTEKFVLVIGNPQSLEQPADWRRLQRLLRLAKRIHKPMLLWNLLFTRNDSLETPTSLELGTAIKTTKMQLLRLPQPIISVYDEVIGLDNETYRKRWGDGTIVAISDEENVQKEELLKANNLYLVSKQTDIPKKISELLDEYSKIKVSELVANRLERVRDPKFS